MANRFETTAFVVFRICIRGIQNYAKITKENVTVINLGSIICLSFFWFWTLHCAVFSNSLSGKFRVLTQTQADQSKIVVVDVNFGISAVAPITLFENTSCNLINIFSKLNFLILQSSNLNSFMDDHLYSSFSCTTSPIHAATSKEIFLKKISERTYLRTSSFRHFSCYTFFTWLLGFFGASPPSYCCYFLLSSVRKLKGITSS